MEGQLQKLPGIKPQHAAGPTAPQPQWRGSSAARIRCGLWGPTAAPCRNGGAALKLPERRCRTSSSSIPRSRNGGAAVEPPDAGIERTECINETRNGGGISKRHGRGFVTPRRGHRLRSFGSDCTTGVMLSACRYQGGIRGGVTGDTTVLRRKH